MEKQKQLITEIMNDDAKDGLYKQQTAVEWLKELYSKRMLFAEDFDQAKQMEREQIDNGYEAGFSDGGTDITTGKVKYHNYYTQTYGQW